MTRRGLIAACLLAGTAGVSVFAWHSAVRNSQSVPWDGTTIWQAYPFEGRPRFEFGATEREMRRALNRARELAEQTNDICPLLWRSFRPERHQVDALFPPDMGWHVLAMGVRMDQPGRLVVDLATHRTPQEPFFEAASHLSRDELLFALAWRVPDADDPEDHGAYRVLAFERDGLRILADEKLTAEQALPPESPDGWEAGWTYHEGIRPLYWRSFSKLAGLIAISWNGAHSAGLAENGHPDHNDLGPQRSTLSRNPLEEWPRPVWFLRWRYEPD